MSGLPPWIEPHWRRFLQTLDAGRLGHALLLAGERGLGKRQLAQHMAARLLCPSPAPSGRACGKCRECTWRKAGTHPDLFHLAPEEDSEVIKVDQVRDLISRVALTAQSGSGRVAILDPADSMNAAAQNALLKTLEEPAPGVRLLLVADAPARLLATIRSRCQSVGIVAPSIGNARAWLHETTGRAPPDEALDLSAGHPGRLAALLQPAGYDRARAVADDLAKLADDRESALAVSQRWSDDPIGHVEDAMAWLRLWSWRHAQVDVSSAKVAPGIAPISLNDAYARALRLRELLRAPLKPVWLLHEWLIAWQAAAR